MRMNFEVYTPVSASETIDRLGWLKYGDDNQFPNYLIELKSSSPVHGALCTSIAAMIAGKGITGITDDLGLAEAMPALAVDLEDQGGCYVEVRYSMDRSRIAAVDHLPFSACRLAVDKETDKVHGVFYSKDWSNTRKKVNEPKFIPLFDPLKRDSEPVQIIPAFVPLEGTDHYPKPDYWGAVNFIETIRQIGMYNVNTFLNGMFPSFIIHMKNGVPDPDAQRQIRSDWERMMTGAKNTGKWLMTFNEAGVDNSPQIEAFPMTEANTGYLEMSYKQSSEQIFIAHRVTTPRLFGVADSGNGLSSNTDEMITGLKIFMSNVVEPKQRIILRAFQKVLDFNKVAGTINIIPNTPIEIPVAVTPVALSAQKKKTALDEFIELGEDTPEGYVLIDVNPVDYDDDIIQDKELANMKFTSTGSARPNSKSEQDEKIDDKLYITRYRYKGQLQSDTREFCRKMLSADKLYRKEDIVSMESKAVNEGWGPEGSNFYSIWLYKGGGACHHFWQKEVYVSAEGLGIDVNSPNAQTIAVRTAEKAGYKIRNEALVAKLPIDMPYEGFLPTNPRFN